MENNNFMKKFNDILESKLMPIGDKISRQRHLKAVRDGMMSVVPLTIIGGLFMIIAAPPVNKDVFAWSPKVQGILLLPYTMTMAIMAFFATIAIAYSLAKQYELEEISASVIAGVIFLLICAPAQSIIPKGMEVPQSMLSATYLDAKGLFSGIIIALVVVEIIRFLKKRKITIKMPDGVPPAVAASFDSIIPLLVCIVIFYSISVFCQLTFNLSFPQVINKLLTPALNAADTLPFILICVLLMKLFWLLGVHGGSIMMSLLTPIMTANLMTNAALSTGGQNPTQIFTSIFIYCFAITNIPPSILALKSKSAHLKAIGKVSLLPAIFNIGEPLVFGLPFVLNPILAIPFIIIPMINISIGYFAVKLGFIAKAVVEPPFTTPGPIYAFLGTLDYKAIILWCVLTTIAFVIYYPFFKIYDKELLKQEAEQMEN
ncbi:PTS transporter subunit EIIC [Clostridium sp. YIM B02555]|uniref:PTS sugar transporter subunit IIC n=1 Tax=Clostridium sp. YIM B02555 TaxID=2911968 RepID=UPI001EEE815F|nr:PTS transporter subunit EIIC [Clostridium sp. YIM B02555]